jgi:hypothetical protein
MRGWMSLRTPHPCNTVAYAQSGKNDPRLQRAERPGDDMQKGRAEQCAPPAVEGLRRCVQAGKRQVRQVWKLSADPVGQHLQQPQKAKALGEQEAASRDGRQCQRSQPLGGTTAARQN